MSSTGTVAGSTNKMCSTNMKVSDMKIIASELNAKHSLNLPIRKLRKNELEFLLGINQFHKLDIDRPKMGKGFLKDVFKGISLLSEGISKGVSKIKEILFFPPDKLPPSSEKVYKRHAKKKIKFIQVRRVPLQSIIRKFLNLVSFGALERKLKSLNYDEIFHLSLYITFEDGKDITVEKNQRINITEDYPYKGKSGLQGKDVDPNLLGMTLEELLAKALEKMGKLNFFQYSAQNRNCQDFTNGILDANGLNNADLRKFIKQDATSIFESLPEFMKDFSQAITDTAGKAQQIIEGGRAKGRATKRTKGRAKKRQLSERK